MRNIDNSEDIIDSRDVIARIDDLESDRDSLQQDVDDAEEEQVDADEDADTLALADAVIAAREALSAWENSDDAEELRILKALADDAEGSPDWTHGETLIRDSYFETYAEQLADDCGMIDRDAKWPINCIDWEKAARELQYDYFTVEFDGVQYWIRS